MEADEDTGVEGILSRLKKHRSLSFDVHMEKSINDTYSSSKDNGNISPRKHFSDFQGISFINFIPLKILYLSFFTHIIYQYQSFVHMQLQRLIMEKITQKKKHPTSNLIYNLKIEIRKQAQII